MAPENQLVSVGAYGAPQHNTPELLENRPGQREPSGDMLAVGIFAVVVHVRRLDVDIKIGMDHRGYETKLR